MSDETRTFRSSTRLSRPLRPRTWLARLRLDRTHVPGLIRVADRVHALDQVIAGSLRPVTLPALRLLLGVLFVWFGGLKIIGRSPVAGLIAQTLPFGHNHLVLVLLGMAELGLGALLISGAFLRLALLAVGLHLAGTFSTFAMAPALMFSDSNPLLLTADGEFVAKNSVLIAAALVLITHTSPRTAKSPVPMPENQTEAPETLALLKRVAPEE
ncbi:DoxX family protein [Pseudarthrobacter albicanus]|uniref:DoxX family protein n=1 Tax=Pseudarthrobacter albicanus TaxID=2823873 RepID=UPI001BAE4093|nr:DoxX family protein [Pseudarthrobacter albicanus]